MRSAGFARVSSRPLLTALGVVGALLLIVLSPLAMRAAFAGTDVDWGLLSDIGQTYGAVSALLAAVGLVILGFSVALQAREVRHAREQAARGTQFELMRMILDDPVYRGVVGGGARGDLTEEEFRREIYLNLLLNWWRMRWEFKDMPEHEVRAVARQDIFSGQPGRDYWRRRGRARQSFANSGRARKFEEVFAEEYEAAIAAGPAERVHSVERGDRSRRGERARAARRAGGVAGGVALVGMSVAAGAALYRLRFRAGRS